MPAGYGNDVTASPTDQPGGTDIAGAIAQIFATGVTAYTDSQAIQSGYQINDPRYFQGGYPGGVSVPYGAQPMGRSFAMPGGSQASGGVLLVIAIVVLALVLHK